MSASEGQRTIGLTGATAVGLGAIVGGGILVLAGAALRSAGPGAILAFALNGGIATLTALTFAEMSTAFPESGGAYTYAKKVLSVRVAFAVGWVLWFAYIVAGVLYALGFAEYAAELIGALLRAARGEVPRWVDARATTLGLAVAATAGYTGSLIRKASGGGQWATVGKVIVFAALIAAGLFSLATTPAGKSLAGLRPFFPKGSLGIFEAMGFTFIALQGFEVIATVAGEVKEPRRTLPRAMLLSLGVALAIYLPLLFVITTVGVPAGRSVVGLSEAYPDTVMAVAVRTYLGPVGYWLVVAAAILSTLSALQANLLAASRIALSMARDRTLPIVLAQTHGERRTPLMAIYSSALTLVAILAMVPDVAAAGAAASLIFLTSFAMAHWIGLLMRRRSGEGTGGFRSPGYPAVPIAGGVACAALAVFQAFAVPAAGGIAAVWLGLGVILFMALFARRAQMVDAFAEAADPALVRTRGRSPLVLVPVANPATAPSLVALAGALATPEVGRVLLLSVMREIEEGLPAPEIGPRVSLAQEVLHEAMTASLASGHSPEALLTVAPAPWTEIARVARIHRCETLLLGLHRLDDEGVSPSGGGPPLEELLNEVDCNVTILRAQPGWRLEQARRILIPVGGKGAQEELRARLLGGLFRTAPRELTLLQVLPPGTAEPERDEARRALELLAADESPTRPEILVIESEDPASVIEEQARASDLVVLGLPRAHGRKLLGELAVRIAQRVQCPSVMISKR